MDSRLLSRMRKVTREVDWRAMHRICRVYYQVVKALLLRLLELGTGAKNADDVTECVLRYMGLLLDTAGSVLMFRLTQGPRDSRESVVRLLRHAQRCTGSEESYDRLGKLLSGTRLTQEYALRALIHLGPRAVPAVPEVVDLISRSDVDLDGDLLALAAEVLGRAGPAAFRGAPSLVPLLAGPKAVRSAAADSLRVMGAGIVVTLPQLRALLADPTTEPETISLVFGLLYRMGSAAASAIPVVTSFVDGPTLALREQARSVLERISDPEAVWK